MSKLTFRVHAVRKMFERQISYEDVVLVLSEGETIEEYPNDTPYPSRLILGWVDKRPVHVVAAYNNNQDETILITTYEPNEYQWVDGYKRRKK